MGLRKQFTNKFVFPNWACAAGFNNNNNNNNCYSQNNYLFYVHSRNVVVMLGNKR